MSHFWIKNETLTPSPCLLASAKRTWQKGRDEIAGYGMFSTTNLVGGFSPSGVSRIHAGRNSFKHAIASDFVHDSISHVKRPCANAANLVQSRRTWLR
jgi:hypothetical protein